MTIKELEEAVKKANRNLLGSLKLQGASAAVKGEINSELAAVRERLGEDDRWPFSGTIGDLRDPDCCFCGTLRNQHSVTEDEYSKLLILNSANGSIKRGRTAVGCAIDEATEKDKRDLSVIVAVGINYGQQGTTDYLNSSRLFSGIYDSTEMRPRLNAALEALRKDCSRDDLPKADEYHLVATNFFPWITARAWGALGLNSIEETLVIKCFGYPDPVTVLCDELKTWDDPLLVFHGAENAVPYLGLELCRRLATQKALVVGTLFTSNLAPGWRPLSNAAALRRKKITREDVLTQQIE